jgi:hypothetical protein
MVIGTGSTARREEVRPATKVAATEKLLIKFIRAYHILTRSRPESKGELGKTQHGVLEYGSVGVVEG